jgi:transcriptional regulator with XRE-family HTH domain
MYKISLAAARKNANLTQEEVAKEMKVSKSTIINWEKGKNDIGVIQFDKLCKFYNVPKDIIFMELKK